MQIAIFGASGLVGTALVSFLSSQGVDVKCFSRSRSDLPNSFLWDPQSGVLDPASVEGVDAVINLMGENIASGRWTDNKKKRLRDSRVISTQMLVDTLGKLTRAPKVLINASAIGIYGNRGDVLLSEESPPGEGFLATVCQEWESAAQGAARMGIRLVKARFGVILSAQGGALKSMLWPFQVGLGGVIGNGQQWMSWISIDDAVRALWTIVQRSELEGPMNIVAPQAVTNRHFTKTLGAVLHRPTILPLPAFVARCILGEMADEILLSSTRVSPEVLIQAGYKFTSPSLELTLRSLMI